MNIFRTIPLLLVLLVAACGGTSTAVFELTPAPEAADLLASPPEGLVVLDVRTPEEFYSGHIAAAVNVDFYEPSFAAALEALDRDTPYFVYCRSGNRSGETVTAMKELGFTEIYELEDGINSWAEVGLPLQ